ncbi:hypothetical protein [Candidatus Uabimicrobium amorphum]|uniref:Uncharacterized protein n=1 Tax=Uabimicrobium amorphum TaxID=2596890 RepID=A0A5S9F711_UABAM|nr:hypothetical protein [Candidatus Uabimicrobium amorphum]BBM88172.1 hypothetical protein UABAM_06589 [Candidatus Uabimicrobium amorphum]
MSKIFERLLIAKQILSKDQLEYYKCIEAQEEGRRHLGEILFAENILTKGTLDELMMLEANYEEVKSKERKRKKDKRFLHEVKNLKLVCKEDIEFCADLRKSTKKCFFELFVEKGYVTPYMVRKLLRKKSKKHSSPEDLVVDATQYQKDRYLGQIAVKNDFISEYQLQECWAELKDSWPNKKLLGILLQKGFINDKSAQKMNKVAQKTISKKYPFYKRQKDDIVIARKIARKRYLSPWRINKCLLKQLNIIRRQKKYVSVQQIMIDDGYLTPYFFRKVLKIKDSEEIKILPIVKEEISDIIKNASSEVHLVLDDEDMKDLSLPIPSPDKETQEKEIEEIEEIDEEGLESIANFTKDHLGITASQTLNINEDDLHIFDDEESNVEVDITLVTNSDDDDDFDFVVSEKNISD